MKGYQTRQRNMLIDFFTAHPDQAFAVEEILCALQADQPDRIPGRSTVYRLVAELASDGMIRRFYREDTRRCLYQYVGRRACDTHLHLKCAQCGALFHLSPEVSGNIARILRTDEHISLDIADTILIGQCAQCGKK